MNGRPCVAVIGAGPAGLIAAETLAAGGAAVTVYDRMPSAGRKLLMAGRGGLNLTHSEPFEPLMTRYGAAAPALRPALEAFPPDALVAWAHDLGQPTFVGSSGRVFPRAMKASPLLRAWLARLAGRGVDLRFGRRWTGWRAPGVLRFEGDPEDAPSPTFDATILALGGASWPRLGSDGAWVATLAQQAGVEIAPLRSANCGFDVAWSPHLRERFAGAVLKTVAASFEGRRVRGEVTIAAYGIEGGAVYALAASLRDAIAAAGDARLEIDLKPDLETAEIMRRLARPSHRSLGGRLRRLGLEPAAIALLHEGGHARALDVVSLARRIKSAPVRLQAARPIARAISSAGGVRFVDLGPDLALRTLPGVFVAGEMLDWEAPTGGYLLQASFATGIAAARGALRHLGLDAVRDGLQSASDSGRLAVTARSFTRPVSSA